MKVIYLHGLNTFMNEARLPRPLRNALAKHGIELIAVRGLSRQTLDRQIEILEEYVLKQRELPVTLLGHSTGGLVSRVVAARLGSEYVRQVITIASPHQGAALANWSSEKFLGSNRHAIYDSLTPRHVAKVLGQHAGKPTSDEVEVSSIICEPDPQDLPATLWCFQKIVHRDRPSDGVVEVASQTHGRILGSFKLDHLSAVGIYFHLSPITRLRMKKQFQQLVETIVQELKPHHTHKHAPKASFARLHPSPGRR